MITNFVNKLAGGGSSESASADTDKEIQELQHFLKNTNAESALKYFLKFEKYQLVLQTLAQINFFMRNTKRSNQLVFFMETLENKKSHIETRGLNILIHILGNFVKGDNNGFSIETSQFFNEDMDLNGILKQLENTYLVVSDMEKIETANPQSLSLFSKYVQEVNKQSILVFCGTKTQINLAKNLINPKTHFSLDLSFPYDFEEMAQAVSTNLNKNGFVLEKGWEEELKTYMNKPTEFTKTKGYSYYNDLIEMLRKEALSDIKQVKNHDKKIMIKKVYFGNKGNQSISEIESLKKLDELIGMNEAKENVNELIAYLEFNQKLQAKVGKSFPLNLHMMFTGKPGTGKTTLARIVAEILFDLGYIKVNKVVEVDKKDLISQYVGHTSIKTNEVIQSARGGVLFIDEAYSIVDDKYGADAISTLIKAMEDLKTELVVIVAGYQKEMEKFVESNPGMASRIGKKIHFEDYTESELLEIYDTKLEKYEIQTTTSTRELIYSILKEYRTHENFGNGRFIDNFIQDMLFQHAVNTINVSDPETLFTLFEDDIPKKYFKI